MNKKIITAALIASSLVALAGCSSTGSDLVTAGGSDKPAAETSAAATPKAAEPAVGVPFEIKQNDGTAKITIDSVTYGPTLEGDLAQPAKNGGYLVIGVTVEAADGVAAANPFYFDVRDAAGHAGEIAIFGVPTPLTSGSVAVGEKIAGNLAWDIAAGPVTIIAKDQLVQDKVHLTVTPTNR